MKTELDNIFPHPFFQVSSDPEPLAPCGCPEWDCSPSVHEGRRYCQACGEDLPEDGNAK